jgi:hypothetical protein
MFLGSEVRLDPQPFGKYECRKEFGISNKRRVRVEAAFSHWEY